MICNLHGSNKEYNYFLNNSTSIWPRIIFCSPWLKNIFVKPPQLTPLSRDLPQSLPTCYLHSTCIPPHQTWRDNAWPRFDLVLTWSPRFDLDSTWDPPGNKVMWGTILARLALFTPHMESTWNRSCVFPESIQGPI
jgi:hypothetical protein